RDAVRVVVAGGGATGCEIAANVDALAEKCGGRAAITIVTGSSRLLRQLPARAAADAERFLGRRGIATRCGVRVARIDGRRAAMSDGRFLEFDVLINATGLRPPPLVAASGLAVDEEGAL